MKILFLGTSAGWPLPRLGCDCQICLSPDSKDKRLRPAILVDEKILIDAPPDIYHQLKKFQINPQGLTDILITHAHNDHIAGLHDLSHIYGKGKKIRLISSRAVLSQIRNKLPSVLTAFQSLIIKPFEKISLNSQGNSWFIPVNHGKTEAFAIKIKIGKPFVYAPEFRRIPPSSRRQLGNIDLAIIDGSSKTRQGQARGHQTMVEGIRLGQTLNAKKIIFTNIGHKTDRHTRLEAFVKSEGGNKFLVAFDGLELKL